MPSDPDISNRRGSARRPLVDHHRPGAHVLAARLQRDQPLQRYRPRRLAGTGEDNGSDLSPDTADHARFRRARSLAAARRSSSANRAPIP